jgi:hypothetical protein
MCVDASTWNVITDASPVSIHRNLHDQGRATLGRPAPKAAPKDNHKLSEYRGPGKIVMTARVPNGKL